MTKKVKNLLSKRQWLRPASSDYPISSIAAEVKVQHRVVHKTKLQEFGYISSSLDFRDCRHIVSFDFYASSKGEAAENLAAIKKIKDLAIELESFYLEAIDEASKR